MTDIKSAMTAESKYIEARVNGEDVTLDLSPYGYKELENYFSDKRDYQLSHCGVKVYDTTMDDIEARTEKAILSKEPSIWIPEADSLFAWHGDGEIDIEACEKFGVKVFDMNYVGGTIVSGHEDLSLEIIIPDYIDISTHDFLEKFKAFFDKRIPNVKTDGNDILVDGYKVLGAMSRHLNDMYVFACHVSFEDRSEIIEKICLKQSEKKPSCLKGITRDELKNEVVSWLQ